MTKLKELIAKLSELFELDKADLDFGIHRIIKSKHKQVREYLETRLPQQVETHLGKLAQQESASQLDELKEQVIGAFGDAAINEAGEINEAYANTPLGEKYQVVRESSAGAQASGKVENEVYSHLLEFFSRYYEDADFMSLRRRTAGRESYSIPYNGEEVVLHWANKDQYYIKSSEDLKDYTFTVPLDSKEDGKKGRVQFRLTRMDAVQNNNKASRIFQLDQEQEITATDDGLVIPFHFAEGKKRAKAAESEWEDSILEALPTPWKERLANEDVTYTGSGERNVLQKHLRNYTRKNTSDYFIHKDLGGFLRRELDFYVKNEVMFLDDIENRPEGYLNCELRKIKAIRAVAHDLIDFMKQFEDFQKKLWLKKKFVVETNWCITLDRIPEEFYPEIAACDAQREEWVKLFAIDEIGGDLHEPKYSVQLSVEFLKANPTLLLDTKCFERSFAERIVESFNDLQTQLGSLLIEGDNFQSLNLIANRYANGIQAVCLDPPYNTGEDGFAYKDQYMHSSWATMMYSRFVLSRELVSDSGVFYVHIDDNEFQNLWHIMSSVFGKENYLGSFVWKRRSASGMSSTPLSLDHEYILCFAKCKEKVSLHGLAKNEDSYPYTEVDGRKYASTDLTIGATKEQRPNQFFPIKNPRTGKRFEANPNRVWRFFPETMNEVITQDMVIWPDESEGNLERPRYKTYFEPKDSRPCSSWIEKSNTNDREIEEEENEYEISILQSGMNSEGGRILERIFGKKEFAYPKPVSLLRSIIRAASRDQEVILDFFAGSGTSGHATIELNREDKGERKFILAEMGEYFSSVLKPRMEKVIYSRSWSDGIPERQDGHSSGFKYILLESYEDTLNNLTLDDQSPDLLGQPAELQNEYLLRYCLDTETSGSLLDCEQFKDPFNYQLKIYDRESGEAKPTKVDLPETFNYLLGLKVRTMQMKEETLVIEGENPTGETVLVIWRNVESMDNEKLDKFVSKTLRINTADTEYAAIYINGDTTLNDPHKKILLTEQVFHDLMFDVEDV